MPFTSVQNYLSDGNLIEYEGMWHTFPVGWVDSSVFDLDEKLVISNLWDRLFLHSDGLCLWSRRVLAPVVRNGPGSSRTSWTTTAFIVAGS